MTQATRRTATVYTLAATGTQSNSVAFAAISSTALTTALKADLEANTALAGITVTVSSVNAAISAAAALNTNPWLLLCMSALCVWLVM